MAAGEGGDAERHGGHVVVGELLSHALVRVGDGNLAYTTRRHSITTRKCPPQIQLRHVAYALTSTQHHQYVYHHDHLTHIYTNTNTTLHYTTDKGKDKASMAHLSR